MLFLSGLVTSGVTFKNDLSTDAVDKGMSVTKSLLANLQV